jgi:hypothetical protein
MYNKKNPSGRLARLFVGWLVGRLASRDIRKMQVSKQLSLNLILAFLPQHTPRLHGVGCRNQLTFFSNKDRVDPPLWFGFKNLGVIFIQLRCNGYKQLPWPRLLKINTEIFLHADVTVTLHWFCIRLQDLDDKQICVHGKGKDYMTLRFRR